MISAVKFDIKPFPKPVEWGYFAANFAGRVTGTVDAAHSPIGVGASQKSFELKYQEKIADNWKLGFKTKWEQKNLDEVAAAFQEGSGSPAARLAAAIAKTLGVEIGYTESLGPQNVYLSGGIEWSQTPFYFSAKRALSEEIEVSGIPLKYEVSVEGRVLVGLSKKGWAWVIEKVGESRVGQFFARAGPALARLYAWLLAAGVIEAAAIALTAIVGTILLVAFAEWATRNARHRGALRGIAEWYIKSYIRVVFDSTTGGAVRAGFVMDMLPFPEAPQLTQEAWDGGQRDAVRDARYAAHALCSDPDATTVPDVEILGRHKARLIAAAGSMDMAKHHLRAALTQKVKTQLGSPF